MLGENRRRNLARLRHSGLDRMTVGAGKFLSRAVFRVRKTRLKSRRVCRSAAITRERVAGIARTDVAPFITAVRRMTRITIIVRVQIDGN